MQWCNIFRDKLNITTPLLLALYTFSYLTAWNVIVEPETVGRQKTEVISNLKQSLVCVTVRVVRENRTKLKQNNPISPRSLSLRTYLLEYHATVYPT